MKVLIWVVCIFVAAFVKALAFGNANLGAIPTLIIYGSFFALAGFLCKQWDERKADKANKEKMAELLRTKEQSPSPVQVKIWTDTEAPDIMPGFIPQADGQSKVPGIDGTDDADHLLDSKPADIQRNLPCVQEDDISTGDAGTPFFPLIKDVTPSIDQNSVQPQDDDKAIDATGSDSKKADEPILPPIRFCLKCGFELLPGSVFCSKCGTKIQR